MEDREKINYHFREDDMNSDATFIRKMLDEMEEEVSPEAEERIFKKISLALQLDNAEKRRSEQSKNKSTENLKEKDVSHENYER